MPSHPKMRGPLHGTATARYRLIVITVLVTALMAALIAPASLAIPAVPVSGSTFSNTSPITLPSSGHATPHPSLITVSGLGGTVTDVNVVLTGITHGIPDDIDVLLVGPFGQTVVLMADTGGSIGLVSVNLGFSDGSPALPDNAAISTGSYRPTSGTGESPGYSGGGPAPAGPYGTALAIFNGTNPNGIWRLFVHDDLGGFGGAIGGGWRLEIATNAPTIHGFAPTSGVPGTLVSIHGMNFLGASAVTFGGVAATEYVVNASTLISAVVPAGAVTGPIAVTTPIGTATSAASYTVITLAPTIASFSPASGPVGTPVVIIGTNLANVTSVAFGGVTAPSYAIDSTTQITATVPAGAASGPISVTAPPGSATSAASFTVTTITTEAPSPATVKRGRVATLRFRVNEPVLGGVADVTIRIQRSGRVVKTLRVADAPMNSLQRRTFTCRLAKGTYRFYVSATTAAGAVSSNTAWNTLKVR